MTNNRRYSENRMSIDSGMTFASILSKDVYDGEELVNAFAPRPLVAPVKEIGARAKRPSVQDFDGHEIFSGQDLVDIFKQHSDRDNSTRMSFASFNSRRYSNISKGSDRRESIMSLMSLADCSIVENDDTLDVRESNDSNNINNIINNNNAPLPLPLTVMSYPSTLPTQPTVGENNFSSTEKVVGNRIDNFQNNINDISAFPSTLKIEEHKHFDTNISNKVANYDKNDDDDEDRIEYIDEIGPYDIICGRNNGAHNWIGNRRFRVTIMMNLKRYTESPTREEKTHVIKSVIDLLMDKDGVGARFIKKVGEGMYERLKDKQIREKVGHAFRDMISLEEKGADELEAKCFR